LIPSLVQYKDDGTAIFGEAVRQSVSADPSTTARWIRRYLCEQSPVKIPDGNGRWVRYEDAAADFLSGILTKVIRQHPGANLVFTLPPDAPREYSEILDRIARAAGAPTSSTLHEYLAAATGCGFVPVAGEPFLIITFSETEPEIAIITGKQIVKKDEPGGIRVIARSSLSTGCHALDSWIVQDLLSKFRMLESDPRVLRLAPQLNYEASRLREQLPVTGEQTVRFTDTVSGKTFFTVYTLADLDRVIAEHDVAGSLQEGIARALSGVKMSCGGSAVSGMCSFLDRGAPFLPYRRLYDHNSLRRKYTPGLRWMQLPGGRLPMQRPYRRRTGLPVPMHCGTGIPFRRNITTVSLCTAEPATQVPDR
jgi:hypothetical protein